MPEAVLSDRWIGAAKSASLARLDIHNGSMTGMRFLVATVTAAFLALSPASGSALAQPVSSLTLDQLERILKDAGFATETTTNENTGVETLGGTVKLEDGSDVIFWVTMRDCAGDPVACESVILFANFNLGREATPDDFRTANHYNDRQVFGRAYILEEAHQVGVDYLIHLGGGVERQHLERAVARWPGIITAFLATYQGS